MLHLLLSKRAALMLLIVMHASWSPQQCYMYSLSSRLAISGGFLFQIGLMCDQLQWWLEG